MTKQKKERMRTVATIAWRPIDDEAVFARFAKRLKEEAPGLYGIATSHFELMGHASGSREDINAFRSAVARDGMKAVCSRFFELMMLSQAEHTNAADSIAYARELAMESIAIAVGNTKLRSAV